ncbi:PorP/SprF family type IX secretion system membrane protein [Galbibacter sp. EGI 63066]|uniref:PorP/SprF family type IX secretion system membrane protein n=1 Tax=Galbibacter sp. EGI 63066 TaxID=2993559 RepID=UPI0022489E28|nr:PorP/SprF family type IX secretion system membrane protein [Galbibacter sp. EGI 63066]MCX2681854.1 PorP/SprF family type IX secretion system membrane protein [Galbibacter sp. EGI 63066]
MPKKHLLTVGLLLVFYMSFSQVENSNPVVIDWRQHNLTKYNKFLVNPTYSYVKNDSKAVSFWSRVQWTGVENSPQTYLLSYSGKVGENSGAGLGLYQQNLGLLVDSGLLLNYAYGVNFTEDVVLTVGINTTLFRRGLNKNAVNSAESDPAILENQDDFLFLAMPGINLSIGSVDMGIYAENIFDYNFNDANTVTDFSDKIFSGQLGYTKAFDRSIGFMEDARWRTLVYGKTLPNEDFQYGFNSLIDLPYTGWFQAGYNNIFGISGGLGVRIGEGISIGINYEMGTSKTNRAFGSTYEAIASIELGPRKMRKNKNLLDQGGNVKPSRNVDDEDFVSSEDIKRKREEAANRMLNEKPGKNDEDDATSKYAVYGGDKETESKSPNEINKNTTVEEGQEEVTGDEEAVAENTEKANASEENDDVQENILTKMDSTAITEAEASKIEDQYQQYLKKADSVAKVMTEKGIDTTAVTTNVFGANTSYRTMNSMPGVEKGFYLVVNVFAEKGYFNAFVDDLRSRGFEPKFFLNPENNYYYVYLHKTDRYAPIKNLQRNNVNNTYFADKWVLWVK